MPVNSVNHTNLNPLSFLVRSSRIYPEKTAVVHGARRWTYRQFAERVARFASALKAAGLKKQDRVAMLCPNIPAMLEAHFAVPAAGGILVTINTRLTAEDIGWILRHSGARWLFVDDEFSGLLPQIDTSGIRVIRVADSGDVSDPYEAFLNSAPEADLPAADTSADHELETISINYTSGTTGRPKGVMYSFRGVYLNALNQIVEAGMNSDSVYLWTLPMFHCNGWCFPWAVTAVSGTHVCLRKVDPEKIWNLIETEKVSVFCGAPTVQIMLVTHAKARRLEREVIVFVAGAPPSPTLLNQMKSCHFRPIHVYGLTETYAPITSCAWHPEWNLLSDEKQAALLARQGHGQMLADPVRVVDDQMNDVPADGKTMGEVVMRGNIVMKGYFEDPTATAEAFRGGWFHSGDLGVCHPDGYIELRDRKKDIIISGGENISTIEVEQCVARHPAVLECAVIAVPDAKWGERPKAFVTLKPGQSVTESELLTFCRSEMAHFKCPVAAEFGPLPKTSTGKVQKFVLREKEWGGAQKRIN